MGRIYTNQRKINTLPVQKLLDKHTRHTDPYEISFRGLTLFHHPEVFNPAYTKVSGFLADNLVIHSGEVCLEMFSGSGALSFLAGKKARKVIGIDISSQAVAFATSNAKKLHLDTKVSFRQGDMWESVKKHEKFDVIFANPPLLPIEPGNLLEQAVADGPEMLLTQKLIMEANKHLKPDGRMYMAFSNACKAYVGDPLQFIQGLAKKSHLKMSVKAKLDAGYEIYYILEFHPQIHKSLYISTLQIYKLLFRN